MPITVTCFPRIPSVEKASQKASVPPIVCCPLCHQYRRNGSQWIRSPSFLEYFPDSYTGRRMSYSRLFEFSDGGIRKSYSKELIRVNCESIIRTEFCRVSYAPLPRLVSVVIKRIDPPSQMLLPSSYHSRYPSLPVLS